MPAVTVRNIPEATHRAIKQRAVLHGVSAEAEIRAILEDVVRPPERVKLGTWLYERSRSFGGVELDIRRDPSPTDAPDFNAPDTE
ncbi:MAG: plasmid stability protein [Acidobacteriaceae bacterium]